MFLFLTTFFITQIPVEEMDTTNDDDDIQPPVLERSVPLPDGDMEPPILQRSVS